MIRERETIATRRCDLNTAALLEALTAGPLAAGAVCDLLKMTPSGVRKYVRRLVEDGFVEIDGAGVKPTFWLVAGPERVAAEVARLRAGPNPPPARPQVPRAPAQRGCFVHIMGDDIPFQPKRVRKAPAHDALHAAFFGAAT